MKTRALRNLAFALHRYVGLCVGLLLCLVGVTGSLLVFAPEVDHGLLDRQIGSVVSQAQRIAPEIALNQAKSVYANQPGWIVDSINTLPENSTYKVRFITPEAKTIDVYVNPSTGKVLGDRQLEATYYQILLRLHYELLAGQVGLYIVGIAAFLLLVLSFSGIFLWNGWRNLIAGFKIKWNAHPKRVNFDIHKVAGITTAVFLSLTAFTGFCWNFSEFANPVIYALTFSSPSPAVELSKPIPNQASLNLTQILQKADAALPNAVTTYIRLPTQPNAAYIIGKRQPQEVDHGNSLIYLDQYSGNVLYVRNGLNLSLGDRVLNSFAPLHYGTFGGLPTRIAYIFVGLAPLILSITGFVMWWFRKKKVMG